MRCVILYAFLVLFGVVGIFRRQGVCFDESLPPYTRMVYL